MPEVLAAPATNWEQKLVAVLAIELTWPEGMDPESWGYEPWTVSAHWEQALVEKVQGFGGSVVQRSPSLLMVAFGLPQTLEQLPQRAVQAALAIRQLVVEAEARAGLEPCPIVRQAVHWGSLLVEAQTHQPAARLLPVSDTLARPMRLLGHAAPGDILVSPEVGRLVGEWYGLRAREVGTGAREVKQAMAYSVVGLSPQRSPLERYGQRPLSRFVGRERELAILQELLGHVEAGQGQVVGLMGEPGVGKTRLLYEFVRTHRSHGWLVLESHADSYGKATPYLPVIDLLKAYFQIEGHDDVQTVREKVTSRLLTLDPALQATLPAVCALLEVPVEEPLWPALDPHQRRQRTLEALKDLWLGESEVQPLLLIMENLHWIDTEAQAFLDLLIDSLPAPRLLLLVSYRPEYQHGWGSKTYYTQLRLDPLPHTSVQTLLDDLLGDDASLEALKRRLSERTEGNPFFLEESVQTLVETQILIGEPGAYHLAAPLPSLQEGLELSARLGDKVHKGRILNALGWVYGELYDLERALRYNREGAEAAYAIGDPEIVRNVEINLGDCYRLAGDLEQAQFYLEKVYQDTQRRGTPGEEWMKWRYAQHLHHSLGELWLTKGDAVQALLCAEACLELASATTSRKNLVKGWRLQGQAFCRQRQLSEAEAALRKALTIAHEIGNPPQLWQTYQALGQLCEQSGQREPAKSAYTSALRVIDEVAKRLQDQELTHTLLVA